MAAPPSAQSLSRVSRHHDQANADPGTYRCLSCLAEWTMGTPGGAQRSDVAIQSRPPTSSNGRHRKITF
jgi:hypothetical protein